MTWAPSKRLFSPAPWLLVIANSNKDATLALILDFYTLWQLPAIDTSLLTLVGGGKMLWSGLCSKDILWAAPLISFIIVSNAVHMGDQTCLERGHIAFKDRWSKTIIHSIVDLRNSSYGSWELPPETWWGGVFPVTTNGLCILLQSPYPGPGC